jgi:hypothetical protein
VTGGAFGAIMFPGACWVAGATRVGVVNAGFAIGVSFGQVMLHTVPLSGDNRTS